MPASAPNPRVAQIEQALDTFQDTLGLYRQQLTHWFLRGTDSLSHAADLPSLMGMDRVITLGNARQVVGTGDDEFITSVAQCPANGELVIESKFESVYDVPLGNIEVEVIPVAGGPGTLITLDEQGVGAFRGEAGKFYRLRVQGAVTPEQLDGLFAAYDGLSGELEHWLRGEWQGFKPQWPHSSASALGNGLLAGSWAAIQGVWDGIGQISELLKDPAKLSEKIADSAQATAALAQASPQVMANALLLASDEAALCLLLRTASLWLEALPPSQVAGNTAAAVAEFVVGLLIDLLIGIVLSFFGIGVAYLGARLVRYGQVIVAAAQRFVAAMFTLVERFMGAAHPYKKLAARGIAPGLKKGRLQLRWDARRNTTLTPDEPHLNAPNQAKNPNGASADTARHTATHGCPVSMVTGEELLTLTDAELDGLLPFAFTRLYRTSAVELDSGLGFGWSHSLSQRLEINDETLTWIDPENRRTPFPMPSAERPAIHNSLSRAAIYLGADADELILAQAGDDTPCYHFRDGHLTAISDAYDNRLHIRRDYAGRIQRLDNGAGRALLLRYDRQHLIAIDYQVFEPAPSEAESWRSAQTLVRYHYDARQRLVEVQNALGDSERYQYDDQHVIVQRQLAGGARFFWEWQREGKAARCVRHWASFGQMDSRYTWDDAGSVRVENIDGSEETYVHDAQARQVRRVEADGGEHLKAYDADGHLIAEQDPLGAVTEYRYDAAGRLIAQLPPDDQPTAYEYRDGHLYRRTRGKAQWTYRRNPQGDLTEQIDPSGHRTQYYRDAKGRLTSISYPDSSYHAFTWNNLGQLIEEQLPDGAQRQFAYDALGRKIRQQDEHGAVTHYQWDALGRLLHTTL
ncbi:YD repeat-containing protein, partial [Pseudomonas sp. ok272]|uniref:DUF6531 domain-containing protein n=1 Tax=Pseudomonas sp. ok272 TaxID=1761897 RepID=UPI0008D3B87E